MIAMTDLEIVLLVAFVSFAVSMISWVLSLEKRLGTANRLIDDVAENGIEDVEALENEVDHLYDVVMAEIADKEFLDLTELRELPEPEVATPTNPGSTEITYTHKGVQIKQTFEGAPTLETIGSWFSGNNGGENK